jgi:hypothetical protein
MTADICRQLTRAELRRIVAPGPASQGSAEAPADRAPPYVV